MNGLKTPPRGLGILLLVGPSMVWAAEFIGSGEVILSTRMGAILGPTVLWAVVFGIFLKYWIGMSGARYTICTGEGMIDMISRMPGPKNWAVWVTLIAQFAAAAVSIGSLAAAAGVFVHSLLPVSPVLGGWLVTLFALAVVWSGVFDILKMVMSFFVLLIVFGVLYVAVKVSPGMTTLLKGLLFDVPPVPDWALNLPGVNANPWREILPVLGWAAGGFASQVWYTYWVIGAEYGMTKGRGYGRPADVAALKQMPKHVADKVAGWCRVVYTDATLAMLIGVVTTSGFLLAGAGVLRPHQLAPEGPTTAMTLATIFSSRWGEFGAVLFLLAGCAALISTQIGQLAGWPRLLADALRICIPAFNRRFNWKQQFRLFLSFFFLSNMILVYSFGFKPVLIVKLSAVLDGLLLTPLQALWILIGLFVIQPRLLSPQAAERLKPHWIFAVGLFIAFLVYGYFCVFQIPLLF
ncbi:MAG: Nramp family divalent metal transporter [candidate division KSB1 bacterium]|nr:Nramp family divalent metal transporter [candidate division KSB1 bacterium]